MSLFYGVIMTLNSKILKQKNQAKIILYSLDSYSGVFLPLLEL